MLYDDVTLWHSYSYDVTLQAAWGGGVLYSKQHRPLMDGVELCDSVVWSLHKLVGAQVQCAALIVKQKVRRS